MEKSSRLHGPSQVEVHYRSQVPHLSVWLSFFTASLPCVFSRRRYLLMFAALIPFRLFVSSFWGVWLLVAVVVRRRLSKTFHIVGRIIQSFYALPSLRWSQKGGIRIEWEGTCFEHGGSA